MLCNDITDLAINARQVHVSLEGARRESDCEAAKLIQPPTFIGEGGERESTESI